MAVIEQSPLTTLLIRISAAFTPKMNCLTFVYLKAFI